MTALQWCLLAFALVASGGLLMVLLLALGRGIPRLLGTAHGLAGLGALVLLFAVNLRGGAATPPLAWWALAVFLGGFVGGLLLFRVIFRDRATLPLAALHGSAGALGLFLLYRAAL
jgi:hypothetical protein